MPCGGIYYFGDGENGDRRRPGLIKCLHCNREDSFGIGHIDHFCMEWDGFLHGACVVDFLNGDMGETVINHMHTLDLGPTVSFTSPELVAVESADQPQIVASEEP